MPGEDITEEPVEDTPAVPVVQEGTPAPETPALEPAEETAPEPSSPVTSDPDPTPEAPKKTEETPTVHLTPEQKEDRDEAINIAKEMYRNKEYQKAIDYFDMALEIDPNNSDAIFFRKRAESKLG